MNNLNESIFYHESAHAVLAKLFEDVCIIESLSANPEYSKQYDPQAEGGLKVTGNSETLDKMNPGKRANKFILIFLAGFCIDRLREDIIIPSQLEARQFLRNQYRKAMYSGDIELIDNRFNILKNHIGYDLSVYLETSIPFLCALLVTEEIWNMIEIVCEELKKSPKFTLTGEQLEKIFIKYHFTEWIGLQGNLIEAQEQKIFPPFL